MYLAAAVRLLCLPIVAAGCARRTAPPPPPTAAGTPLQVSLDLREAELALAAITARTDAARDSVWRLLSATTAYRRLAERERSMGRAFDDSAFVAFLRSDTLAARAGVLARTLAEWRGADHADAARRALAYLPAGTVLRATMYVVVKPRTNSFVYDLGGDPAIFMYLDPALSRAEFANTAAHELHHVGLAAACSAAPPDSTRPAPARAAARWAGAFGEGVAMLAAAGGPDVHPHAASPDSVRARWDRDVASAPADMQRVAAFFEDVLDSRLGDPGAQRAAAMAFFGDAQGAWYTVGYLMARTVETTLGRGRLVASLCDGPALMSAYNEAVTRRGSSGGPLPAWPAALLDRLK